MAGAGSGVGSGNLAGRSPAGSSAPECPARCTSASAWAPAGLTATCCTPAKGSPGLPHELYCRAESFTAIRVSYRAHLARMLQGHGTTAPGPRALVRNSPAGHAAGLPLACSAVPCPELSELALPGVR